MNTAILDTSSLFLQAVSSYWGIPPDQLILGKQSGAIDGVFSVQLTIALTPGDLVGITHRMGQMAQPEAQEQQEPVFVPDDLNLEQLRDDYAALTQAERGKYKSFQRYKAQRMAEQFDADVTPGQAAYVRMGAAYSDPVDPVVIAGTDEFVHASEGVGGRKVQHVDVAEEPEPVSELPDAVWLSINDANLDQMPMASDINVRDNRVLLQVALLTPEQKAKYCGEQKP